MPSHTKAWLAIGLLITQLLTAAQAAQDTPFADAFKQRNAQVTLGYEVLDLPRTDPMGVLGASYLVELMPELYAGPAAFGAIYGDRGGFYSFGAEAAWHHPITPKLSLQAGVYVGG